MGSFNYKDIKKYYVPFVRIKFLNTGGVYLSESDRSGAHSPDFFISMSHERKTGSVGTFTIQCNYVPSDVYGIGGGSGEFDANRFENDLRDAVQANRGSQTTINDKVPDSTGLEPNISIKYGYQQSTMHRICGGKAAVTTKLFKGCITDYTADISDGMISYSITGFQSEAKLAKTSYSGALKFNTDKAFSGGTTEEVQDSIDQAATHSGPYQGYIFDTTSDVLTGVGTPDGTYKVFCQQAGFEYDEDTYDPLVLMRYVLASRFVETDKYYNDPNNTYIATEILDKANKISNRENAKFGILDWGISTSENFVVPDLIKRSSRLIDPTGNGDFLSLMKELDKIDNGSDPSQPYEDMLGNMDTYKGVGLLGASSLKYICSIMTPANGNSGVYTLNIDEESLTMKVSFIPAMNESSNNKSRYLYEWNTAPSDDVGPVLGFTINYHGAYRLFANDGVSMYRKRGDRVALNNDGNYIKTDSNVTMTAEEYETVGVDNELAKKLSTSFPFNGTLKVLGNPDINILDNVDVLPMVGNTAHHSKGRYIVTAVTDDIGTDGYITTLSITKMSDMLSSDSASSSSSGAFKYSEAASSAVAKSELGKAYNYMPSSDIAKKRQAVRSRLDGNIISDSTQYEIVNNK